MPVPERTVWANDPARTSGGLVALAQLNAEKMERVEDRIDAVKVIAEASGTSGRGEPDGVAGLDADGDVVDAAGTKVLPFDPDGYAELVDGKVLVDKLPAITSPNPSTVPLRRPSGALAAAAAASSDELVRLDQYQAGLLAAAPSLLGADFDIPQSSTALVASTLSRAVSVANATYRFHLLVLYDVDQAADLKLNLEGPAGATVTAMVQGVQVGATTTTHPWYGQLLTNNGAAYPFGGMGTGATTSTLSGTVAVLTIAGHVKLAATTGTLRVKVAQNVSQALKGAIKAGSTFDLALCAAA